MSIYDLVTNRIESLTVYDRDGNTFTPISNSYVFSYVGDASTGIQAHLFPISPYATLVILDDSAEQHKMLSFCYRGYLSSLDF